MFGGPSLLDEPLLSRSSHGTFDDVRSSNVFRSTSPTHSQATVQPLTSVERVRQLHPLVQIAMVVLFTPFMGFVFVAVAVHERGRRVHLTNPSDWKVLATIGAAFQISSIVPMAYAAAPVNYDMVKEWGLVGDFWGPILTFVLAGLYMTTSAVIFVDLQSTIDRGRRTAVSRTPSSAASNRDVVARAVDRRREELRHDTELPTQYVVLVSAMVSLVELTVIRTCRFSSSPCTSTLLFWDPSVRHVPQFWMSNVFYFLIYWTTNAISMFAVVLHYQQLRVTEAFTFVGEGAEGAGRPPMAHVENLAVESNATVWVQVWQKLVLDVKRSPATRAMVIPTVIMAVVLSMGGITYVVTINLVRNVSISEFTAGSVQLGTYSTFILGSLIAITVRLTNVVDFQTKRIAAVQNEVQRRIDDEKGSLTALALQSLHSKVRVLQALDVFLRHADSRPKLVGMSLETMRWVGILVGLVSLNAFFFGLYISRCNS